MSAEIRAWYKAWSEEQERKRDSALKEAHDQGISQGISQGERAMLLRLLRARFGSVPTAMISRVEAADVATIERWGERILAARTLAEVFDDPN
jgi:hypothetical protein